MTEMAKALSKEIEKNEQLEKQLTKAKKYIGFLLAVVHIKNTYNKEIEEEIAKAEAFLKE